MKRFITLSIVASTAIVATWAMMAYWGNAQSDSPKVEIYQPDWMPPAEEHEEESIKMYDEFAKRAIVNQKTGTIDLQNVMAARRQVMTHMSRSQSARALGLKWEFMGPSNIGGRSRDILFDRTNPNRVLAGGVTGGLFISDDGGLSWRNFQGNDTLAAIGVVSMVQAANGDIYVGTGENPNNSNNAPGGTTAGETGKIGEGIWKSTDGGNTFTQLASTIPAIDNSSSARWAFVPSLAAHPTDGNVIVAGTNDGAMVTTDGGQTWSSLAPTVNDGFIQDLAFADDGTVHLVRNGRYFKGLYNDATTFNVIPGLFDNKSFRRMMLGLAPSDNQYVYIIGCNNSGETTGVYRSTDGGDTWSPIAPVSLPSSSFNPTGEQGWFDMEIAVHPKDKNRAFVAGQLAMYAYQWDEVGQKNLWWPISSWVYSANPQFFTQYVHADQHRIRFHPNGDWMYVTTDGGVFRSKKVNVAYGTVPVFEILNEGFSVTQFYGIAAGIDGRILGGTQDNGTILIDFTQNSATQGKRVHGGDGFFTDISKLNPDAMFSGTYFGAATRSASAYNNYGGGSYFDFNIDCEPRGADGGCSGDGVPDGGAGFYYPQLLSEEIDSTHPYFGIGTMFLGAYDGIWAGRDALDFGKSASWYKIASGDNGMQTYGGNIFPSNFAVTESGSTLFVTMQTGEVYRIDNLRNTDWKYLDVNNTPFNSGDDVFVPDSAGIEVTLVADFNNRYVSSVAIDPNDSNHVVVTLGNYGNADYVYESTTATTATGPGGFTNITGNLPRMPVYAAVIDAGNPDNIILGTEMGIYTSANGGFQWELDVDGFPLTPVYMLKQEKVSDVYSNCYAIYAGTHGRGIYMTRTLTASGCSVPTTVDEPTISKPLFEIFPNPVAEVAQITFTTDNTVEDMVIEVFDLLGRKKLHKSLGALAGGNHTFNLDVSGLEAGNYIVVLRSPLQQHSEKIVVTR